MAKKHRKKLSVIKRLDRQFTIAKVLLAITPVVAYVYVSMRAAVLSMPFQEILSAEPTIAILFLIAMINPYIAFLLGLVQKKLKEENYQYALTNMLFLLVGQALTMNIFYFCMLLYLYHRMVTVYKIKAMPTIKSLTLKKSLYMGGGGLIVICMCAVCMLATVRIM